MSLAAIRIGLAATGLLLLAAVIPPTAFELPRLNRTYLDPVEEIEPWREGHLTVHLSSPSHRFTLHSHRAWLQPSARGTVIASLDLEFEGSGEVIADLEMGHLTQRIVDQVEVPRQERSIRGEIQLWRVENGYTIRTLRLPSSFRVRIESRFANRLVEFCRQMSALPLVALDCSSFAESLNTIDADLPPPGESYLLPDTELDDRDRQQLDAFLATVPPLRLEPEGSD